jgi:DNA-binding CsgD family transcriptional regulator
LTRVAELVHPLLDSARLLFDLQQVNAIAQAVSGCLEPAAIARQVTHALVERFDCIFARIWLVESDRSGLRLVASAGLYTHLDGSFARVPMGAYKVGKIAQNRVPFLSNNLPEEAWVKDRSWAMANRIQGFAGYPLAVGERVIGVLAAFSCQPFAPEFLEVLQVLCMTTTVALDAALQAQLLQSRAAAPQIGPLPLSDQIAAALSSTRLILMGTEKPLPAAASYVFLRVAEQLNQLGCSYCRLSYGEQEVALEALGAVSLSAAGSLAPAAERQLEFAEIDWMSTCAGGSFRVQMGSQGRALQYLLRLPYTGALEAASPPAADQPPAMPVAPDSSQRLSERELEIMQLLAQGQRDRDIARQLHISESTVKFHINNSAVKLNAKNRYQAVYQAAVRGWLTAEQP